MSIKKLDDAVINAMKAGEIVERPASVLKELLENSLDSGAKKIVVDLHEGGRKSLMVQDDGVGIEVSDMDLLLERFATSKFSRLEDLWEIESYGFRGEALASIAEVARVRVVSKTKFSELAFRLVKEGEHQKHAFLPVDFAHGTQVFVEDLFWNVPARKKFLKNRQSEHLAAFQVFLDAAYAFPGVEFVLKKNGVEVLALPAQDFDERVVAANKSQWRGYLRTFENLVGDLAVRGVASDARLRFPTGWNLKFFVNGRPIQDKILRRAVLDAYYRVIPSGDYPFLALFLDLPGDQVDVNVHPRKQEVKFENPSVIFNFVKHSLEEFLQEKVIPDVDLEKVAETKSASFWDAGGDWRKSQNFQNQKNSADSLFAGQTSVASFGKNSEDADRAERFVEGFGSFAVVGQLRNCYILLEGGEELFVVDQHALAERIAFEKLRGAARDSSKSEPLLEPVPVVVGESEHLEEKLEKLRKFWFDLEILSAGKVVVYGVPEFFAGKPVDLPILLGYVLEQNEISLDKFWDDVFASRACKTSIKAGDRLSFSQMTNLISEGFRWIEGLFVCQHGRSFFFKIPKKQFEKLVGRE